MTRATALSVVSACAAGVVAQPDPSIFVPPSAATAQEVDEVRQRLKAAEFTDKEIDEALRNGYGSFVYREADLRAAFAGVRPSDRKISVCGNSIMNGATQIVFISEPSQREVTVKTSSCRLLDTGLWCNPMTEAQAFFIDSLEHFFLVSGVTLDEARTVLDAYEHDVVPELDDWFAGYRPSDLTQIAATRDGYELTFGEVYCGGCTATVNVRFDRRGDDEQLVLVGEPKGFCI